MQRGYPTYNNNIPTWRAPGTFSITSSMYEYFSQNCVARGKIVTARSNMFRAWLICLLLKGYHILKKTREPIKKWQQIFQIITSYFPYLISISAYCNQIVIDRWSTSKARSKTDRDLWISPMDSSHLPYLIQFAICILNRINGAKNPWQKRMLLYIKAHLFFRIPSSNSFLFRLWNSANSSGSVILVLGGSGINSSSLSFASRRSCSAVIWSCAGA